MKNKSEKISRHCGRGPRVQGFYKEKTALLNELDPGSMSGMTTKRAFTLIELLVVVLIIGILAAVAVPQYQKAVEKARLTEALVLGKHIRDLEETYYLANGDYTNSFVDLGMDIPAGYSLSALNKRISATKYYNIDLENVTNKRAVCYYASNNVDLDFALFFYFQHDPINKGKTECYPYSDHGTELCKTLNL